MTKPGDLAMMNDDETDSFLDEMNAKSIELGRRLLDAVDSRDADSIAEIKKEFAYMTRLLLEGQKENEDRIAISKGTKAAN